MQFDCLKLLTPKQQADVIAAVSYLRSGRPITDETTVITSVAAICREWLKREMKVDRGLA